MRKGADPPECKIVLINRLAVDGKSVSIVVYSCFKAKAQVELSISLKRLASEH